MSKGMEQSAYATHNATAMLLAYMTCDVGAHHNRSWAITYDLQVGREKVIPEKVARVIWLQNFRPMFDVLGGCRLQWVELNIDRDLYVPALEAITGIHRSWADLEKVGERIWNLTRLYWARENEDFGRAVGYALPALLRGSSQERRHQGPDHQRSKMSTACWTCTTSSAAGPRTGCRNPRRSKASA